VLERWVRTVLRFRVAVLVFWLVVVVAGALWGVMAVGTREPEPLPAESELWSLPNLILTPHSSWATDRMTQRSVEMFRDNLDRYQRGEPLRNVVDLSAGY